MASFKSVTKLAQKVAPVMRVALNCANFITKEKISKYFLAFLE